MKTAQLISTWARKGAETGADCGKMCSECAFKLGSRGNKSAISVDDAAQTVAFEMNVFHCHMGDMPICAGFLYAKAYFEKLNQ